MIEVGFEPRQSGFKDLALNIRMILPPVNLPSIQLNHPFHQPAIYPAIYPTIQPSVHSNILPKPIPSAIHLSTHPFILPSIVLFTKPFTKHLLNQLSMIHPNEQHLLSTSCVPGPGATTMNKLYMFLILLEISVYKERLT